MTTRGLFRGLLGISLFFALSSSAAWAYTPLRDAGKLASPTKETVLRVPTAKVVLADYALIRRDFAETRAMSDAQVDEWLLSNTAFVSKAQAAQTRVNTPIATTAETALAFRPKDYGRAIVFQTAGGSLIDGKGVGVIPGATPSSAGHADGLATLGEATREFLYEKLVRTVLVHQGSKFETVEHYAVIDWGFDVIHADGSTSPAGMILRQSHTRAPGRSSVLDDAKAREVELMLRRYGLTSAGAYRKGATTELINIQGTPDNGLLDFGGYLTVERFDRPGRNFFSFDTLLEPGQIDFVQPVPRIRVPFQTWGYGATGIDDPKMDNPWVWSHELARNYRAGIATRASFKEHFENLVGSYRRSIFMADAGADAVALEALVRAIHDIH